MEKDSILKMLDDERIFSIQKQDDGGYKFMEGCDDCFEVILYPDEIRLLIAELQEMLT
jgi:hypothetical protein